MTDTAVQPNKQQLRTERSTNALLEAAADLIVEGGLDALTFAAIGDRAGYSRGLVTARFGNKDGLLDALIDRIVTTWSHRNVVPRTRGRSGIDAVGALLDAIRRQAAIDPRGLRVLYSLMFEALGADDALRGRFAALHASMRADVTRLVQRGLRDGSIGEGHSPDREAALIVGALRGLGYQWLLDPQAFEIVEALEFLRDTTLDRLGTKENP